MPHTGASGEIAANALDTEREAARPQLEATSIVSPGFRTPLAIIDSAARRLMRGCASLRAIESDASIDTMRCAVARLVRLMERTLSTARAEVGAIMLDCVDLRLSEIILDVVREQSRLDPVARIEFSDLTEPLQTPADPRLMRSVLETPVSNSFTYSDAALQVRLQSATCGGLP